MSQVQQRTVRVRRFVDTHGKYLLPAGARLVNQQCHLMAAVHASPSGGVRIERLADRGTLVNSLALRQQRPTPLQVVGAFRGMAPAVMASFRESLRQNVHCPASHELMTLESERPRLVAAVAASRPKGHVALAAANHPTRGDWAACHVFDNVCAA